MCECKLLPYVQIANENGSTKTILKKNKIGRLTLSGLKTYYKVIVIKTTWYWQKIDT